MLFSSLTFIIFFAIVLAVMLAVQVGRVKDAHVTITRMDDTVLVSRTYNVKHVILLVASYVFYGWWDWRFCFLMLAMTVIAHLSSNYKEKKIWRVAGIVFPLVILGIFKYFNFFVDSFCTTFGIKQVGSLNIILPIGISFFTFQAMSYTIDAFKGTQKEPVSFLRLALYIAFFPALVAGPIIRAQNFLPQLNEDKRITLRGMEVGIQIFLFGLFKKIVLADHLAVFVDQVFDTPAAFGASTLILAVVAYSLQIYFDFSGYSDMATGCSRMLGYDLLPNFNMPYISRNVTEFWKRWHISLSSWLQQYLYFSLGGNRKGKTRTYVNLMATMTLGGLWHGANWTFVIWGILHGAGLCAHKLFSGLFAKKETHSSQAVNKRDGSLVITLASILVTYTFVCFCWIFFRASTFDKAFTMIHGIFTWKTGVTQMFSWAFIAIAVAAIGTLTAVVRARKQSAVNGFYPIFNLNTVHGLFILFLTLGITLGLAHVGDNPFIYFQF